MRHVIVIIATLAIACCAGELEKAKAVQEGAKVQTYGELIDLACNEVMVDTVVRAGEARPELADALPILCPETIGVSWRSPIWRYRPAFALICGLCRRRRPSQRMNESPHWSARLVRRASFVHT